MADTGLLERCLDVVVQLVHSVVMRELDVLAVLHNGVDVVAHFEDRSNTRVCGRGKDSV